MPVSNQNPKKEDSNAYRRPEISSKDNATRASSVLIRRDIKGIRYDTKCLVLI